VGCASSRHCRRSRSRSQDRAATRITSCHWWRYDRG
jgi:hypothetical protein